MSQENVEIVKRGIDAFNHRNVDLLATLVTPDFAWFPALPGVVEGDGYRGREGIERYFEEIANTWEELRVIGGEFRDLGDRVVVLGRTEGRGRGQWRPGRFADWRHLRLSRRQDVARPRLSRSRRGVAGGGPLRVAVRCRCPVTPSLVPKRSPQPTRSALSQRR